MSEIDDRKETQEMWNSVAADWQIQVGDEGDSNRRLNSDPVLWAFAGDVAGLSVLDAGCGTGYLSRKLADKGALVTGIDFSEKMIEIALAKNPQIDFREDSCSELRTIDDELYDLVVSNYVLMDTPDLRETMEAFSRVLKTGGMAILIFSHPCFPQGQATISEDGEVTYRWHVPYFQQSRLTDPPWAHFTSDFIWFHRPLSDYWKAFAAAGFSVVGFEEPRLSGDRRDLALNERKLRNSRTRPYSVAFKLRKG
jgi:ubiquinone/menaquinone biosynthesis C-methylase UbiE